MTTFSFGSFAGAFAAQLNPDRPKEDRGRVPWCDSHDVDHPKAQYQVILLDGKRETWDKIKPVISQKCCDLVTLHRRLSLKKRRETHDQIRRLLQAGDVKGAEALQREAAGFQARLLRDYDRRVFDALISKYDPTTGDCEPTHKQLAGLVGRSIADINRSIWRLREHGLVNSVRRTELRELPDGRKLRQQAPTGYFFDFVRKMAKELLAELQKSIERVLAKANLQAALALVQARKLIRRPGRNGIEHDIPYSSKRPGSRAERRAARIRRMAEKTNHDST